MGCARNLLCLVSLLGLMPSASWADESRPNDALICQNDPVKLMPDRYLRALSLDLRGHPPTMAEIESLDGMAADEPMPEPLIDAWLNEPSFVTQVIRKHRSFFWNNISNVDLVNPTNDLGISAGIYWGPRRSRTYRTGTTDQIRCLNEPAQFDAEGRPIAEVGEDGFRREGWVEVAPYWAPDTRVRVCAYDAQERLYADDGTDCSRFVQLGGHRGCGCGPNLRWCAPAAVEREIRSSLARSLEKVIEMVISGDRSYLDMFQSRAGFINGPIVHWLRYLGDSSRVSMTPTPIDLERTTGITYPDKALQQIRLNESHAGVLTAPVFLLRFQTNRARASRFYEAFLCSPFVPPDGGLPAAFEESALNPDLQIRAGCKYCHSSLEPAAAHWGRWAESGIGFLSPEEYPASHPQCLDCAMGRGGCTQFCRNNYLTRSFSDVDRPYLGMLNAYAYRRDRHMHHVEEGPKLLARKAVASNAFPLCVARKTAEWLTGRTTSPKDNGWLGQLARDFVASGFRYKTLVKAIVTSPQYRRVR